MRFFGFSFEQGFHDHLDHVLIHFIQTTREINRYNKNIETQLLYNTLIPVRQKIIHGFYHSALHRQRVTRIPSTCMYDTNVRYTFIL